jgi:DNA repair protein RadC
MQLENLVIESLAVGPRERLALHGPSALSDAELLAVVLGTGAHSLPVMMLASQLLEDAAGLHGLARRTLAQLAAQRGMGTSKACRLLAAFELGVRVHSRPLESQRPIASSRDVAAALQPRFAHESREHFLAIALDAKNRPLAQLTIAIGGLTACGVTPGDVFRPVLQAAAAGVVFVHNHPSGDPAPSDADVLVTERLVRAGQLLGISVFDHVVVGAKDYFSFADAGWLTRLVGPTGDP